MFERSRLFLVFPKPGGSPRMSAMRSNSASSLKAGGREGARASVARRPGLDHDLNAVTYRAISSAQSPASVCSNQARIT